MPGSSISFGGHRSRMFTFPACLTARQGLTKLDLSCNQLKDLPDGPFLSCAVAWACCQLVCMLWCGWF